MPREAAMLTEHRQPLRVLLVEDCEDDAALVRYALRRGGYDLTFARVETRAAMVDALAAQAWDIVIADHNMPCFSAPAALLTLQNSGLDLPFLIVSGSIGDEVAVEAMQAGAHDYIMKDNLARLVPAVARELRDVESRARRRQAERGLRASEERHRAEAEVATALARVGREMISSLDTPVLLNRLCRLTTEVLECEVSHTLLLQPEDDCFVPISAAGISADNWEAMQVLRLPRTMFAGVLELLEDEDVAQVRLSESVNPAVEMVAECFGLKNVLYMALRGPDALIGLQTACRGDEAAPFASQHLRIARGLAQSASLGLANARLVEKLDRASRLKSEFVATMSHELRTPLNIITGYTDLLATEVFGPVTAEQRDALQRMERSSRQLIELIGATLDLSRLEAGRVPVELTDVDLAALIDEVSAEVQDVHDRPDLALRWRLAAPLPPLRTDVVKLKIVLKNLIANAVKFTERGEVVVAVHGAEDGVEICVTDTGIGMEPQVLQVIFEPFRQGDSSMTRRYGGVGLGLHIVKRLVDLLGGRIAVESVVGQGSKFCVWIPGGSGERRIA